MSDVTEEKYTFSKNSKINSFIYQCFEYISELDKQKFIKRFRKQSGDETQVLHTFRELVLGAYLEKNGVAVRHDYKINEKTPDWVVLESGDLVTGVVELVNFHIDKVTEESINSKFKERNIWCDWVTPNNGRLYQRLQEKSERYQAIVEERNIPYVVAVFGDFKAGVELEEIHEVLFQDCEGGLFKHFPTLSGVLFFEELGGSYSFKYFPNPSAASAYSLNDGII
jgi:hypothetical protein